MKTSQTIKIVIRESDSEQQCTKKNRLRRRPSGPERGRAGRDASTNHQHSVESNHIIDEVVPAERLPMWLISNNVVLPKEEESSSAAAGVSTCEGGKSSFHRHPTFDGFPQQRDRHALRRARESPPAPAQQKSLEEIFVHPQRKEHQNGPNHGTLRSWCSSTFIAMALPS